MVFTLEPGIYLDGWGGVRIEDMVLLDKSGPRLLTQAGKQKL
jgi:Xaa-Pro aminopeptidase